MVAGRDCQHQDGRQARGEEVMTARANQPPTVLRMRDGGEYDLLEIAPIDAWAWIHLARDLGVKIGDDIDPDDIVDVGCYVDEEEDI
jgi:hypothetical protein